MALAMWLMMRGTRPSASAPQPPPTAPTHDSDIERLRGELDRLRRQVDEEQTPSV